MQRTSSSNPSKIGTGKALARNRYERKFRRGSLIFIEGETSTEMYIIRSGAVRILKQEGDSTVELAVLGAGSVLGELSLLDHQPRSATAQVVEDVTATVIDEELLKKTLDKIPSWLSNIIHVVVKRLRDTLKRTSDDIVNKSIAGVVRIALLLHDAKKEGEESNATLPLTRVKELVYAIIGLGDIETENVFLHLILKDMIFIRKEDNGTEYLLIKECAVLRMYLSYLRTHQHGKNLVGEEFSPAAFELLETISIAGDKNGKRIQERIVKIGQPQIEIEQDRLGRGQHLNLDALDELCAAKIVAREEAATRSTHGTHKRITLAYNRETVEKLLLLRTWLPTFREEIRF